MEPQHEQLVGLLGLYILPSVRWGRARRSSLRAEPWWGRVTAIGFRQRLHDLETPLSTGSRFKTAGRDVVQHRVANFDWEDD